MTTSATPATSAPAGSTPVGEMLGGGWYRSVYAKTLADRGRGLLGWIGALTALDLVMVAMWPSLRGQTDLNDVYADLPDSVLAMVGGEIDISTGTGFLNAELFSLLFPIAFIIYAIGFAASAIAGEEGDGTADLLLSLPVSRRTAVVHKWAALITLLTIIAVSQFVVLALGSAAVDMDLGAEGLIAALAAMVGLGAVFGGVALFVGCATGRRGAAIAVASGIAGATYLANVVAQIASSLEWLRWLSPFWWSIDGPPIETGFDTLPRLTLLAAVALVAFAASIIVFERRDLR